MDHLASLCDPPENKLKTYGSTQELLQIIADTKKMVVVINYITHNNELIYVPDKFKFSELVIKNEHKIEIYIRETKSEKPEFDISSPTPCWSFRVYNSSYSGVFWLKAMVDLQSVIDSYR